MRRIVCVTFVVALSLACAAATATARSGIGPWRESPSATGTFTEMRFENGYATSILCPVTLAIGLESFSKAVDALAGTARMTVGTGSCSDGDAGILVGEEPVEGPHGPYHLTYVSFSGTLPNITSISLRLNDVAFWIEDADIWWLEQCRTEGTADIALTSAGGTSISGFDAAAVVRLVEHFAWCDSAGGEISGSATVSPNLRILLI